MYLLFGDVSSCRHVRRRNVGMGIYIYYTYGYVGLLVCI